MIIGSKDTNSHISNSQQLYDLLNCKKKFYLLDNIPHDLANTEEDKKLFTKTLDDILEKL